jgi:hypothetical protein
LAKPQQAPTVFLLPIHAEADNGECVGRQPPRRPNGHHIPRIRIPGEHTRDRSVLVGKLAEILRDQRPTRKVTAMFIDMAFGSPIYERLRALGFNNVFETNFGLVHTPDRTKANMRAHM